MKALSIKGLRKVYKGGFEALKGIDLDVQEGTFLPCWAPMAPVNQPL